MGPEGNNLNYFVAGKILWVILLRLVGSHDLYLYEYQSKHTNLYNSFQLTSKHL